MIHEGVLNRFGWPRNLVLLLTLVFGLSFALNFGSSNQVIYLLPSLQMLDPSLWNQDWLTTQTHHYHPAFALLGAGLMALNEQGWGIACANVLVTAATAALLLRGLQQWVEPQQLVPSFIVTLVLASAMRTVGPGLTYVFSSTLQASTFGSLGMIAACVFFIEGRSLASGLALAFAGVFHANYLILGLFVFGVSSVWPGFRWREPLGALWRPSLLQLAPPCVVLLGFLPLILTTSGSAGAAESQQILQDLRAPHHFRVETFFPTFLPWIGWQLLAVGALRTGSNSGSSVGKRLLSLLTGCWLLLAITVPLSSWALVRAVNHLFTWRLAPHFELIAQMAFAGTAVRMLLAPDSDYQADKKRLQPWAAAALLCFAGYVVLARDVDAALAAPALLGMVVLGRWILARWAFLSITPSRRIGAITAAAAVGFLAANAFMLSTVWQRSNLLGGKDTGLAELCTWARERTSKDAIFLTPPDEEGFRFHCQRAIVIDWKSNPIVPAEVIEWKKRLEDVLGNQPLRKEEDLKAYANLTPALLAALQRKYKVSYLVMNKGQGTNLGLTPAFQGSRFTAFSLN